MLLHKCILFFVVPEEHSVHVHDGQRDKGKIPMLLTFIMLFLNILGKCKTGP